MVFCYRLFISGNLFLWLICTDLNLPLKEVLSDYRTDKMIRTIKLYLGAQWWEVKRNGEEVIYFLFGAFIARKLKHERTVGFPCDSSHLWKKIGTKLSFQIKSSEIRHIHNLYTKKSEKGHICRYTCLDPFFPSLSEVWKQLRRKIL